MTTMCGSEWLETWRSGSLTTGVLDAAQDDWEKDIDEQRMRRGQQFYADNEFGIVMTMYLSLISGLSIEPLLRPLIFTGKSDSAEKALRRYAETAYHVRCWLTSDLRDKESMGRRSLSLVRQRHASVAEAMRRAGQSETYFTQHTMGVVQLGFVGASCLFAHRFGIRQRHMDDYIYVWYLIGRFLGIDDQFNICNPRLPVRDVLGQLLVAEALPALCSPPADFWPMAHFVADLPTLILGWPVLSTAAVLSFCWKSMSAAALVSGRQPAAWAAAWRTPADYFRVWLLVAVFALYAWLVWPLRPLLNRRVGRLVLRLAHKFHFAI